MNRESLNKIADLMRHADAIVYHELRDPDIDNKGDLFDIRRDILKVLSKINNQLDIDTSDTLGFLKK